MACDYLLIMTGFWGYLRPMLSIWHILQQKSTIFKVDPYYFKKLQIYMNPKCNCNMSLH